MKRISNRSLSTWARRCQLIGRRMASTSTSTDADVIVIGGGHAGCEAAAASARCGSRTMLLTHKWATIGEMSCNPSFGGIGKGHLVREVDALDGVCARICDKAAITYQALNRSHGAAVLGLRAQIDRQLYKQHMQNEIGSTPNLQVVEGEVDEILVESQLEGPRVKGVRLADGKVIRSKCIVITTGTFLGAEIFLGPERIKSGRMGDKSSTELSRSFSKLGFALGRLRTGTPPRIYKDSIDFSQFQAMAPDKEPIPFSFMTEQIWLPPEQQLPTYVGYTNQEVRKRAEAHLHENEHVREETKGPRYCPSFEAKIIRFPQLDHRLFLEHEGLDSPLIYPQGMSMSFKPEVQLEVMRAIPGLEKIEFSQPGYGVQYDFVDPRQLKKSLETRKIEGLFLAGQINGTTGYEEAAAQGVLAGVNAAARANQTGALLLSRTNSYLGVLVDDLTSLGTNEPYRMFTSRAECRLHLRPDNADLRLTQLGRKHGAVGDVRWKKFTEEAQDLDKLRELLKGISMPRNKWTNILKREFKSNGKYVSAYEMLHRHSLTFEELKGFCQEETKPLLGKKKLEERLRIEASYSLNHERHMQKVAEIEREASVELAEDINYRQMEGLSEECAEKLCEVRPLNLAAASRVPGITPEALVVILRHIRRAATAEQNKKTSNG
ncbi:hypothetical protein WR25_08187 [Diploscapter pachys]|uniref:tRNA uridine 5-carboxymethylaminomethyl modification enzyme C-terminal subdomain domain-containing protein n=1 Tax=Diploscapter pachys TaxID=2018661 RepID=A0A2A2L9Z3_9BILA|nr:hypothetical protein WR25_08187 [Diploscapter pachys]